MGHVNAFQHQEEFNQNIKQHISDIQAKVEEQQTAFLDQNTAIATINSSIMAQIHHVFTAINERTHIESGLVTFGDSSTWTPAPGNHWFGRETITFKRSFSFPPQVVTSVERFYNVGDKHLYFKAEIQSVTNTGFTLETWTDHDYLSKTYYLHIYWLAAPAYQ